MSHHRGGMDDQPTFTIEHLATFTVAKETGIVYPADGMRRLLQLEKSNGIWSQKMQMRLSQSWVLIMDYETGAVMERFPVELIQEPTAFTSHDPLEIYNNILVFIVGEERPVDSHSEMHIFQCQSVPAQELVEDLKLLRAGKLPLARRERRIPPPPSTPPPDPPINVREQVSIFNSGAHHAEAIGRGGSRTEISRNEEGSLLDETSSTSSERYERDVTILNHCFDDIEKFIARLQHAAAASRELERRRRNRKSKKKDLGDGMLTMRAKPPPEVEFIDVFQKFKLSFNLLAKLKAHIHDPNAPELVHFLFTPLALIVDASHDTHYGPNLPAKVVSPLLTREAVNLLINCVTSKETELWHSLGDAWLISRDQWKGFVTPYHPVFMDGWSPEYPVIDEHEPSNSEGKRNRGDNHASTPVDPELREYMRGHEDSHFNNEFIDYEGQKTSPGEQGRYEFESRNYHENFNERARSKSPESEREFAQPLHAREARSDISVDSIERTGHAENQARFERTQAAWLEDLIDRNAKIVRVTYPRTANNDKELTVIRGEYLEILDDSRKWWKGRNARGQIGHVPHTIVSSYTPGDVEEVFNNPLYSQGFDRERHFVGRSQDEVDARKSGSESPLRTPPMPPPAPADWVRKERLGKKGIKGWIKTIAEYLFHMYSTWNPSQEYGDVHHWNKFIYILRPFVPLQIIFHSEPPMKLMWKRVHV